MPLLWSLSATFQCTPFRARCQLPVDCGAIGSCAPTRRTPPAGAHKRDTVGKAAMRVAAENAKAAHTLGSLAGLGM